MANERGIKETTEVLDAMGALAVLVYKAQKNADGVQEIGAEIAKQLMVSPQTIQALKDAADGIKEVPAEMKDLTLGETFELVAAAGRVAASCSSEIKE